MGIEDRKNQFNGFDPTDDGANWRWGIIYYNPDDKRIFPPKRIKAMGWTVNWANPLSIGAFILLCVALVAVAFFMDKYSGNSLSLNL